MKPKLTLLVNIFCTFMFFNLKAQITITEADLPNTWTVLVIANDTTPNSTLLAQAAISGANKTWNLTAIQNERQDTMEFMDPADTPYDTCFPTANLANIFEVDGDDGYFYLLKNSNGFYGIGLAMPYMNTTIIAHMDQTIFVLPITYQTHFTDTSYFFMQFFLGQMGADSVRVKGITYIDNIADGWGNVTTQTGTYNVIRTKEREISIDTTWIYITGLGWMLAEFSTDTSYNYSWLANSQGFPVAGMSLNATQDTVTYANYLIYTNANVPEIPQVNNLFSVYPNPAQDYIILRIIDGTDYELRIYDLLGKEVLKSEIRNPKSEIKVDLSGLNKGLYLYRTLDKNGKELNKGKIIIE